MTERVILITGAASGIGKATAEKFLDKGCTVVGVDFNEAALERTAGELGDKFIPKVCDVAKDENIAQIAAFVRDRFGKLDVLFSNAGAARMPATDQITDEDFHFTYDLLVKASMQLVKHFTPLMLNSDSPSFIVTSSLAAITVWPSHSLYSTAKLALDGYVRNCARDIRGIRFNSIQPGLIDTPIYAQFDKRMMEAVFKRIASKFIPAGRVGTPEDVANVVSFLASEEASYVNGTTIIIDGGWRCGADLGIGRLS